MTKHGGTLCSPERSLVVFLDIQEKLIAAVEGKSITHVVNNASRLLQAAHILHVPVLFTEQYSDRLGGTHPTLLDARPPESRVIQKTSFSAYDNENFRKYLDLSGRREIILCGIEAHVCVLQTAFSLLNDGYSVYVVEDAVCSRTEANKLNGLRRIEQAGGQISNRESVLYEWIRDSQHPNFREIIKQLIR